MHTVDNFADLGPGIGFRADLIKDQTAGAGVVQLVETNLRERALPGVCLVCTLRPSIEAFHGALAFDDKEGVV